VNHRANILSLIAFLNLFLPCLGQSSFKIPVYEEGVYKISAEQAQAWGLGPLENIAFFGFPGMLPQTLDSLSLRGKQIPSMLKDNALYVFLSPADQVVWEEGPTLKPHLYSDTLFYEIRTGYPEPLRVREPEENTQDIMHVPIEGDETAWYRLILHKKEETNLLSSGRSWYGNRMLDGQSTIIPFEGVGMENSPIFLKATFLSQSLTTSSFTVGLNGATWNTLELPPIPNTTYGIKGREGIVEGFLTSGGEGEISLRINFGTSDRNGMGYLKHLILGIPVELSHTQYGTFYCLKNDVVSHLPQGNGEYIWDITDFFAPKPLSSGNKIPKGIRKISIFTGANTPSLPKPKPLDTSLKSALTSTSFLIIAPTQFRSQANRLAQHKTRNGLATQVVEVNRIYDAYAQGNPDISAIRNFIADIYHDSGQLKNVLFFGKGTFDYKGKLGGRPNLIPTYTSRNSLNPLTTFSSDDFFGFLEWGQGEWEESNQGDHALSIGIGRIPAITAAEARDVVDKIIAYENPALTPGKWKKKVMLIADDGDNNIHLRDAELHAGYLYENHPEFILEKAYLDRFEQINVGNAQRSPQAREAIQDWLIEGGALINFIGHGNETTLTAEEIIKVSDIRDWPETAKLPVFVTATCEFGRHDSPFIRSGAEELLLAQGKGVIAMLTTGRPVFSSVNYSLNKAFIEAIFKQKAGEYLSLGEIFSITKNNSLNGALNRNFSLLGDPSLKIQLPEYKANTEELLDVQMNVAIDTLMAMQRVKIEGSIVDPLTGALSSTFGGSYELSLLDKPIQQETLGDENPVANFSEPNVYLFRGKGSVSEGRFTSEFLLPRHIQFQHGRGVIRIFASAEQGAREAMGAERVMIGGTYPSPEEDLRGPEISIFLQDSSRNNYNTSSKQVRLILGFKDKAGINISPLNLSQQLSITLNDQPPVYLGDRFVALEGQNLMGIVDLQLGGLIEGINEIRVQAFDNLGNRTEKTVQLEVRGSFELNLGAIKAYPNPASEKIRFSWQHNRAGENLVANLRIFSVSGHEIFSTVRRFPNAAAQLEGLEWFFLHNKTNYPIKGTYLYVLELLSENDGSSTQQGGKIIIQ
jgi:hypothetical protein